MSSSSASVDVLPINRGKSGLRVLELKRSLASRVWNQGAGGIKEERVVPASTRVEAELGVVVQKAFVGRMDHVSQIRADCLV